MDFHSKGINFEINNLNSMTYSFELFCVTSKRKREREREASRPLKILWEELPAGAAGEKRQK
jgi:hypothetical protein